MSGSPTREPFLRRVRLRNYKSVAGCEVELAPLTLLVGRNGAGKSNFLDALRFVKEGLEASLEYAIQSRGGIDEVRRRSTGHPRNFSIDLEFALPGGGSGRYGFEIAARQRGTFAVNNEQAWLSLTRGFFHRKEGQVVEARVSPMPPVVPERLYLVNAAGLPDFRPAFDALLAMGFYNPNPEAIRALQKPDAGELLHRDGGNLASVVARLAAEHSEAADRVRAYLATIVPGVTQVERVALGPRETLEFRQEVAGAEHPWKFYAASMSDGTLRALGALVAVAQLTGRAEPVHLVGIEEPETALHPAAAGALMDALREASSQTQILVTTHSPDLLDQIDLERDRLLVVVAEEGTTRIAPADSASLEAVRRHLYTPGELLRMDLLQPDPQDLERQEKLDLFPELVAAP
jgi:predicted ATPase